MAPSTHHRRPAVAAMLVGLALTIVALLVPHLDRAGLAGHIRAGYPGYGAAQIDTAVNAYLIILSVVGAVGIVCWLVSIRAVAAGSRWARGAVIGVFVVATALALTALLIKDTSGDTGLSPLLGWVGLLPCLPGAVAVGLLLHRHPDPARPA